MEGEMIKKFKLITIISLCIIGLQMFSFQMQETVKASVSPKLEAGYNHTLNLKDDGTVWAWGKNNEGQLGLGDFAERNTPTKIPGLTNIIDISVGQTFSMALKSDGTVWTWGSNQYGELGNNSLVKSTTPIQVPGLTNITQISAAAVHSMALKSDGTVWTWGFNYFGQLGNGDSGVDTNQMAPIQVKGIGGIGFLTNIKQVDGGSLYSMALSNDGSVYSWGQDPAGGSIYVLGTDDRWGSSTPIKVENPTGDGFITNIKKISTQFASTLLLTETNEVYSFGANESGQLGLGNVINYALPQKINSLTNVKDIEVGENHSTVVKNDGTVWSFGGNSFGQLGDNSIASKTFPVQVINETGIGFLDNIQQVSAGTHYTIALKSDGTLFVWGSATDGKLGNDVSSGNFIKPVNLNFNLQTIPTNAAQTSVEINPGLLSIGEITNQINFENYELSVEDALVTINSPFEFSVEDFTGTWNGWNISLKINTLTDGAKTLIEPTLVTDCLNSKVFDSDSNGLKTGIGTTIQNEFSCLEDLVLFGTTFPLLSATGVKNTSAVHYFVFPTNFLTLNYSNESQTGNYTAQTTIELTSGP
jgi:alpha-tubulin suppressor-like RCC1 family protein